MVIFKEGSLLFASAAVDGPPAPPPTMTRFLPMMHLLPVTSIYRKKPSLYPRRENPKEQGISNKRACHTICHRWAIVKELIEFQKLLTGNFYRSMLPSVPLNLNIPSITAISFSTEN